MSISTPQQPDLNSISHNSTNIGNDSPSTHVAFNNFNSNAQQHLTTMPANPNITQSWQNQSMMNSNNLQQHQVLPSSLEQ